MMTLGEKLAILLKENNMNQKELAEKIGTTEMTVSRYVRNERQPKADVLSKIASVLNTTTDDLLNRTESNDDEAEFQKIHRLIARNASKMSVEKKQKLIATLLKDDE
jgi:transcriptional regulator with XRE-family HTH domain